MRNSPPLPRERTEMAKVCLIFSVRVEPTLVGMLPTSSQWFEEVRCSRTSPNSLGTCPVGLLPRSSQWFREVRCGRTAPNTLGTCPVGLLPPYVRVLIARGWANRSSGKAWDDSSRESRTVVPRARPVVQAWHVIFLISASICPPPRN